MREARHDFDGHGRRGDRHRREHLRALFTAFRRVLSMTRASARPAQIFVGLPPACWPEGDALYIHTPNPNGTKFPYAFDGVLWDVKTPAFLREFVAGESWEVGVKQYGKEYGKP